MDYDEILSYLIKEGTPYSEAEGEVQHLFDNALRQLEGDAKVIIPELPEEVVGLFSNFMWSSSRDGTKADYVRAEPETEMYSLTKDPILSAHSIPWRNGKTLIEAMNDMYLRLAHSGKLPFVDKEKSDSADGTSEETILRIPTLTEYWRTHIKSIWEQDGRFRLSDHPTTITTDPNTPCFFFFDLDKIKEGEHPHWTAWLTRVHPDARPVLRAWLYSIFDPQNKGRQCVWFTDKGYSGKSSVFRALTRYMGGHGVASVSHGSMSDKFGYGQIFGKRLVVYGDNKNPKLLHSEKIHSILGGDVVQIERKFADAFSGEIYAKVMVASNIPPEVDLAARNEISRIFYVPLNDPPEEVLKTYCQLDGSGNIVRYPDGSPKFVGGKLDELLFGEMDAFLYTCAKDYKELCPQRRDIPLPDRVWEMLQVQCPSPEHLQLEQFLDERLEIADDKECTPAELDKAFQEFKRGRSTSFDQSRLTSYLEVMGCRRIKLKGKRLWKRVGIKPKTRTAGGSPR